MLVYSLGCLLVYIFFKAGYLYMHRNMTERIFLMFNCSAGAPVHVCVTASFISLSLLFAFLIRHWECICPHIYPLQSNASVQNTVASLCNRYLSPEVLAPFNRAENDDCFSFLAVLLLWINLLFVLCNLCYLHRLGHGRTNKTFSFKMLHASYFAGQKSFRGQFN